jgi:hypothetical protein
VANNRDRAKGGAARLRKAQEDDPAAVRIVPEATFQPPGEGAPLPRLPEPHEPVSDSPTLTGRERAELAACEAAIDNLRRAFIDAGQALEVIREGRHYREDYGSFDTYCVVRWGMQRAHADRLIREWRLGRKLDPIGSSRLVEAQVRELLPVASRHGEDAAVTVYKAVAEAPEVKVTAKVLEGAVAVLPEDEWDEPQAIARIRAYLAGELQPAAAADPGEQVQQVRARLRKLIRPDVVRAAGPAAAKELADELRHLAEQLEAGE